MKIDTRFIDSIFNNANKLIRETHNYIKWQAPLDIEYKSREELFKMSCEAMRVAVRMTQIMGWLMLQKAILEGDISRKEIFSSNCHILQGKMCLESSSEIDQQIPPRLRELLKESRQLYLQIMKLEEISLIPLPQPEEIKRKGFAESLKKRIIWNTEDKRNI